MALTSLVVCADLKAVQVLSQILRELNIGAEHCGDLAQATARLAAQPSGPAAPLSMDPNPYAVSEPELLRGVRLS